MSAFGSLFGRLGAHAVIVDDQTWIRLLLRLESWWNQVFSTRFVARVDASRSCARLLHVLVICPSPRDTVMRMKGLWPCPIQMKLCSKAFASVLGLSIIS